MSKWINDSKHTFGFAAAMEVVVCRFGRLTERQAVAVRKCMGEHQRFLYRQKMREKRAHRG